MKFHPAASIMPDCSPDEYAELKTSIGAVGLLEPIITFEGQILDGRHRYRACVETGQEPRFERFEDLGYNGTEADFVLDKHKRRNLTIEQKAAVAVARKQYLNESLGERRGRPAKKVENFPPFDGKTRDEAGAAMSVTGRTVSKAEAVQKAAPDVFERMKQGQYGSVETAAKTAKLAPEKRARVHELMDAGLPGHKAVKEVLVEERVADLERQAAAIAAGEVAQPDRLYNVISIDPPWPYGTAYESEGRRAANPYPEMSLDQIRALEIPAADDCVLFLWTTHKFMRHSFDLLDAWGFRDVAIITWVKDRMGLGQWLRSQSEFCIMAVKGRPLVRLTNQTTVLHGPMREHSRKPDEFFDFVDGLCVGAKIDFFSRERRDGWDQLGNDPDKFGVAQ